MFRIITAVLLSLCLALPARAVEQIVAEQDNQPQETGNFTRLLEKLRRHPVIASSQAKAESSSHYAKGELGLPDPMLFVEEQDYPIGSSMSRNFEEKMVGFKQEIPTFGVRSSKAEKTQADARKQRLAADYAFASMKAKLIATLADWQAIREEEKLLDRQARLLTLERTSIKGRIAADQVGVSRLTMSQAESVEVGITRAELREQRHEMETRLINLVGETPNVKPPQITMARWDGDVEKTYPVAIAAKDTEMARKDVDMRKAEFDPHFEVQASYGRMYGGDNAGTIMAGISIPLWASESQQPRLEGARAALHSSELDKETIKRDVVETLDHLQAQITASRQTIGLLETKIAYLEASAKALTREYEAGKADLSICLKTRRDALSARIALAQERAKRIGLIADFNHYFIQGDTK